MIWRYDQNGPGDFANMADTLRPRPSRPDTGSVIPFPRPAAVGSIPSAAPKPQRRAGSRTKRGTGVQAARSDVASLLWQNIYSQLDLMSKLVPTIGAEIVAVRNLLEALATAEPPEQAER